MRLLILAAKRINQSYRDNPEHQALFMSIIRSPYRLYDTLVAMKRYGVLGNYIPAFGQIMGLMQYDLFHIYTVDAHTLLLLRNLNRFREPEFAKEFPCSKFGFPTSCSSRYCLYCCFIPRHCKRPWW